MSVPCRNTCVPDRIDGCIPENPPRCLLEHAGPIYDNCGRWHRFGWFGGYDVLPLPWLWAFCPWMFPWICQPCQLVNHLAAFLLHLFASLPSSLPAADVYFAWRTRSKPRGVYQLRGGFWSSGGPNGEPSQPGPDDKSETVWPRCVVLTVLLFMVRRYLTSLQTF